MNKKIIVIMFPDKKGGVRSFCESIADGFEILGYKVLLCNNYFSAIYYWLRYWANVMFITNLNYCIFGFFKKKSIFILHGYPRYDVAGFKKYIKVFLGHQVGVISNRKCVAVSRLVNIVNLHYFGIKTDKVIYNPVRKNFLKKNLSIIKEKKDIITYIGRIEKEKNIENIIIAFQCSNIIKNNFSLIICGDGSQLEYMKSKYSNSNIQFKGYLEINMVRDILSKSKIFISLSDFEPFGISIAEAAMLNNYIVTTPTTGIIEILPQLNYKLVKNPDNIDEIKNAIDQCIHHIDDYKSNVNFDNDLSPINVAKQYLSLFHD